MLSDCKMTNISIGKYYLTKTFEYWIWAFRIWTSYDLLKQLTYACFWKIWYKGPNCWALLGLIQIVISENVLKNQNNTFSSLIVIEDPVSNNINFW